MEHTRNLKLRDDVPRFAGTKFSWRGTEGSAEASELGPGFSRPLWKDSVYSDAGFIVNSHRTGKSMVFILEEIVSEDNEPVVAVFKSQTGGFTVRVWND